MGVLEDFAAWYSIGRRESSLETVLRYLELFKLYLERRGKSLERFDQRDVIGFISWMISVGYDQDSVALAVAAVKKLIRYFCEFVGRHDMCEVYTKVKVPRVKHPPPRVLDPGVIREFIERVPDLYWKTLFAVLYETGARVSEVVQLRIGDLNRDAYGYRVTIRRSKSEERTVRVIEYAELLDKYLSTIHPSPNDPNAWLFPQKTNTGKHVLRQQVSNMIRYYANKLGYSKYRLHPHLFRHVRVYELLKEGLSEKYLLTIFGWKTRRMVDVYAKLLPQDIDEKLIEIVRKRRESGAQVSERVGREEGVELSKIAMELKRIKEILKMYGVSGLD